VVIAAVYELAEVWRKVLAPLLALLTARSNKSPDPNHFFVSDRPSETKAAQDEEARLSLASWRGAAEVRVSNHDAMRINAGP
jgi:hypothetical protein